MTLAQYWAILLKQWKLVVLCFLLVGVGAFVGSKLMHPLYQSSTLIQVIIRSGNSNQADYNNLMASDQLVQTEATLATSNAVLSAVASHYSNLSVGQLSGEVSSAPKTSTQLFEIDVIDPNPLRAAKLANDVASTLIKQQEQEVQQQDASAQLQMQNTIDQIQQQIDDTTNRISALQASGGNQGQLALLQSNLSGLQQKYNQWQSALAQLELTQVQGSTLLQVVQAAQPAISPVRPNILLNTGGGLIAGLLIGVLLALLYEQLNVHIHDPEEIAQLSGWSLLAAIARVNSSKAAKDMLAMGQEVNAEAYRILRTNLGFSALDKPVHSILVTSAVAGEGKSTTSANLAIFFAKAGKSTLLIDIDLHRPVQHNLFNLASDKLGMSNALLALSMSNMPSNGVLPLDTFIHTGGISDLWVMPTGPLPPNPAELFESKAMQRFLSAVSNCGVEVVIFDASPLLGLSDTMILAPKVDGVLVVVDTTRATKQSLGRMKEILSQPNVRVLGCVANKIPPRRGDGYYGSYVQRSQKGSATSQA